MSLLNEPYHSFINHLKYQLRGYLGEKGFFDDLNPPILVLGVPNSGTTIFTNAIAQHPSIYNEGESVAVWDPLHNYPGSGDFKTDYDASQWYKRRLRGNFAYYQWLTDADIVINKQPKNTLRIHFLKEIFPDSKIIHIIRDPRAVVCSNLRSRRHIKPEERVGKPFSGYLKPRRWREWIDRDPVEQQAYLWNDLVSYATEEGPKYENDYQVVYYENLETKGHEIIKDILEWRGLEYSDSLIKSLPEFENRNHKWKDELTHLEINKIKDISGNMMEKHGYSFQN